MLNLNKYLVIFVSLTIFVLLFLRQCNETDKLKRELDSAKAKATQDYNNLLATKDSVRIYKLSNGNLVSERRSFVYDINQFKNSLSKLYNEYNSQLGLNNSLKNTNALLKAKLSVKDTIYINNPSSISINDSTKMFTFNENKDFGNGNSRLFNGSVVVGFKDNKINLKSSKFDISQSIKLYAAIEEKDGYKSVKMSSAYPGIKFDSIENINLINNKLNEKPIKKARWSIGFGVGYGMSLVNGQTIQYGPTISAGLYWSPAFLQF